MQTLKNDTPREKGEYEGDDELWQFSERSEEPSACDRRCGTIHVCGPVVTRLVISPEAETVGEGMQVDGAP